MLDSESRSTNTKYTHDSAARNNLALMANGNVGGILGAKAEGNPPATAPKCYRQGGCEKQLQTGGDD